MDFKKTAITIFLLVGLAGSASAQNVQVDGLDFEGVNESFTDSGVDFEVYNQTLSLSAEQVFVPDNLSDKATFSNYNYVETESGEVIEWTGYTFSEGADYGDADLNALLGNRASEGVEQFEEWDGTNQILYEVGTIVEYQGSYYEATVDVYNSAGTPPNVQSWEETTNPGGGSEYEANYFQTGAVSEISQEEQASEVFDTFVVDENQGYNVSLNIQASSHYEHLILDYQLVYENESTSEVVHEWQDVYSGEETERIPVSGDVEQVSPGKVTQSITKDNLYENTTTEKLVVAQAYNTNVSSIDWNGLSHERLGDVDYSELVRPELDSVGAQNFSYIDNPEDFEFTAYNVTFPEDSKRTIEANFSQPVYNPLTDDPENFNFEYYSYIIGSVATFKTETSSEWDSGSFSQTRNNAGSLETDIYSFYNPVESQGDGDSENQVEIGDTGVFSEELTSGVFGFTPTSSTEIVGIRVMKASDDTAHSQDINIRIADTFNAEPTEGEILKSGFTFNGNSGAEEILFDSGYSVSSGSDYDLIFQTTSGSSDSNSVARISYDSSGGNVRTFVDGSEELNTGGWIDSDFLAKYSSGSYSSQVYSASEKKIWRNITVQGTIDNAEVKVQTSNDDFSTILEQSTIYPDSSGTYNLSFREGATDVRYDVELNSKSTSLDSVDVQGQTANFQPLLVNQTYNSDRVSVDRNVSIDIDDGGETDITGLQGISSPDKFNNKTIQKNTIGIPFTSSITVSDVKGAVSPSLGLGIDEVYHGLRDNDGYSHDTSVQQAEDVLEVVSSGSSGYDYNINMGERSLGVRQTSLDLSGSVSGSSNKNETVVYQGDWLKNEKATEGYSPNTSRSHDLDVQYALNGTTFSVKNERNFTFQDVNISSYCPNTGLKDIQPGENTKSCETTEEQGDFLKNEKTYNLTFGTGIVRYGSGFGTNFTAEQPMRIENEINATFNTNVSSLVREFNKCSSQESMVDVPGLNQGNVSVNHECVAGEQTSYQPVVKTETKEYYVYEYKMNFSIYQDAVSSQPQEALILESRLDNWEVRDPAQTQVNIDGISSDTSVGDTKVVESQEVVPVQVGTDRTQSSVHEGNHTLTLNYYESKTTKSSSGDSGSSSPAPPPSDEETEVGNVSDGEYSWSVSTLGTDQKAFGIQGRPGRAFDKRIEVENTGDKDVTLSLECQDGGSEYCQWVQLGADKVELNTDDFQRTVVRVNGKIPENATLEPKTFSIKVSDPNDNSQLVDFNIRMNPFASKIVEGVDKVLGVESFSFDINLFGNSQEIEGAYPFIFQPLFFGLLFFFGFGLFEKQEYQRARVLGALILFIFLIPVL